MARFGTAVTALSGLLATSILGTHVARAADPDSTVPVTVTVLPMAMIQFIDPMLLYLEIPPPATTAPGTVRFLVTGNASASLTAIPDEFVFIPSEAAYMGKAVLNSSVLGYKVHLHFPSTGIGQQSASLPGNDGVGTTPLLTVALAGGTRQGEIRIDASPAWTPHGGMPALGIHVGEVILTLTAEP